MILNKRIILLKPDTIPDGRGGQMPNPDNPFGFIKIVEAWAEIKKPKMRPIVVGDGIVNDVILEFLIRYFPDIELGWRVKCENKTYDVLSAYSEGRVKTFVTCREVVR